MRELPLTNGGTALVDDDLFQFLSQWDWQRHSAGYATRCESGESILMHRVVLGVDDKVHVDHKNGDRLDNQRENLRRCTRAQNNANARKRPGLTSKYKGVSWEKSRSKWTAHITSNYKNRSLGRFETEEQAALAYNAAASRLFGEFARLNEVN